jgi:hypothetical protein
MRAPVAHSTRRRSWSVRPSRNYVKRTNPLVELLVPHGAVLPQRKYVKLTGTPRHRAWIRDQAPAEGFPTAPRGPIPGLVPDGIARADGNMSMRPTPQHTALGGAVPPRDSQPLHSETSQAWCQMALSSPCANKPSACRFVGHDSRRDQSRN